MPSATQARADRRVLFSAALMGSGIGLALGVSYLSAGMAQASADHLRAARIAQAAQGGFSEAMLRREMNRMDPAALRVARAHDGLAAHSERDLAQAWRSPIDERSAVGHRVSPLESARQLDCLTQAVYFEARGETPRGQAAVAQVVMNRVNSPSFPKTVCGVVFQGAASHGCQFSFACDGSMRHGVEVDAWDRARLIAERSLSGVVLADIGSATHFHTTAVQPNWGSQMLRVAQVGLHVFYRLNPHSQVVQPDVDRRAVFVSLPIGSGGNFRVAAAILEKAADATAVAAGLSSVESKAAPLKPTEAPSGLSKASEPPSSGQPTDIAAS